MSFTQIEKKIIITLGKHGPMGVGALMPQVDGLESKAQLKNILGSLSARKTIKLQSNGQWGILKATYAQLLENGSLKSVSKSTFDEVDPLQDLPTTQGIGCKAAKKTSQAKTKPVPEVVEKEVPAVEKSAPETPLLIPEKAEPVDLLRNLMETLPEQTAIALNNEGITVSWNSHTFEPSTEELNGVVEAIGVLQKHMVAA